MSVTSMSLLAGGTAISSWRQLIEHGTKGSADETYRVCTSDKRVRIQMRCLSVKPWCAGDLAQRSIHIVS
jgi:hypothetical protein